MTTTITISTSPSNPTPIAKPGDPPTLFANMSSNDTITISDQQSFNLNTPQVVTLLPGAFVVIQPVSELYAACGLNGTQMEIIPGGLSYAAPGSVVVNLSGINQNVNGTFQVTEQSGFKGIIPAVQSSIQQISATTAASVPISATYTINANDAFLNSIYEFEIFVQLTQGTSTNASRWDLMVAGSSIIGEAFTAAQLPASHNFAFWAKIVIGVSVSGATGNLEGMVMRSFVDLTGGGAVAQGPFFDLTGNTFSSLVTNSVSFNWHWTTVTGGPIATGIESSFTRIAA